MHPTISDFVGIWAIKLPGLPFLARAAIVWTNNMLKEPGQAEWPGRRPSTIGHWKRCPPAAQHQRVPATPDEAASNIRRFRPTSGVPPAQPPLTYCHDRGKSKAPYPHRDVSSTSFRAGVRRATSTRPPPPPPPPWGETVSPCAIYLCSSNHRSW